MRLLLDTHVLLWWLEDDPRLRPRVRAIIADRQNEVFVSAASFWELSIKRRKGGIESRGSALWQDAITEGFMVLAVASQHLEALEGLALVAGHNDPFDHMILAQARAERAAVITHDRAMAAYGVPCIGVA
jgi:PIN domain nuclease of toxin-antitoxin system